MERQRIRKLTLKILKENCIYQPPVDLLKIAEKVNAIVELTNEFPPSIDGSLSRLKDGRILIVINANRTDGRKIFTLAHELGHIFLNHWGKNLYNLALTDRDNPIFKKAERHADIFAAEILMPAHMVKKAFYSKTQTVEELAELFQVSYQAMEIRLQELGLL